MLHIVLLILKIIGIILGTLLGILLLGLCLALFVPLRYQFEAERAEGEGRPPIEVQAKFTWLLHFINVKIRYPAEVYVRARILFITVFRLPKKAKAEKTKKQKEPKERGREQEIPEEENPEPDSRPEELKKESREEEEILSSAVLEEKSGQESPEPGQEPEPANTGKQKKKRSLQSVIATFKAKILKICALIQNIWYTLKGICDKIKTIWENIDYYLTVLKGDAFRESFALCKEELGAVFSYIRPRKIKAELIIGMGDPASTAQILSYYGMLYPLLGDCVSVTPDFDEKRIEGTVFIKGKVKLFTFVKAAVRIYFNKDIRKLLKLFKKEDV